MSVRELQLDTGLEEIQFRDELGRLLATVWFNPTDMGIASRARTEMDALEKRWKDKKGEEPDLAALEQEVRTLFDKIFACPFSETVFENISPLALMEDGRCFYESLLDAMLPVMEQCIREKAQKSHEHLQKYLS